MMEQNAVKLDTHRIVYEEMGQGPLVLLVHGFPDTAQTWRAVMPRLAEAGFHVVAPYLRGFAPSDDAPGGLNVVDAAQDLLDLAAHLRGQGAADIALLAGHDIGAEIVVEAAVRMDPRPRVATLSTPPAGWPLDLAGPDQMKRSWYAFLAARPDAPALFGWDDFALLDQLWADWAPGWPAEDEGDLGRFRTALSGGRLDGALEYYRAQSFMPGPSPSVPVLHIHGLDDGRIGADVARVAAEEFAPGSKLDILPGVGHFPQLEAADHTASTLISWAKGGDL